MEKSERIEREVKKP